MHEDNFVAQNSCTIASYAFIKNVKTFVQVLSTKISQEKNQLVSMLSKNKKNNI